MTVILPAGHCVTKEKITKALKINIVDLVAAKNVFKDVFAYDKTIVEKVQLMDWLEEQEKKSLFFICNSQYFIGQ